MQSQHLKDLGLAWTGKPLDAGMLPAFFYFALTADESLHLDPFCQPVNFLKDAPMRCFSLTLPFHGEGIDPKNSMALWAEAVRNGEDFLSPFLEKCVQAVDALIEMKLVDPAHLFVGGLSRGGFVALHLAARDPRFRAILGFAPLTKLPNLAEFKDVVIQSDEFMEKLVAPAVRFYIGNRDERVSTESAVAFILALTEAKHLHGQRSPQAEIIITPSIGYKGHGTSTQSFNSGAQWIIDQFT